MAEAKYRVKLLQAARLTGRHKTTILRAIAAGRLSATVGVDGYKRIDVAELERVYGTLRTVAQPGAAAGACDPTQPSATAAPDAPAVVAVLQDTVAALRAELERTRTEAEHQRAELRRDLEAERDERRRLVGIIERAQLTDQRATATASPAAPVSTGNGAAAPRPRRPRAQRQRAAAAPEPSTLSEALAGALSGWLRVPR